MPEPVFHNGMHPPLPLTSLYGPDHIPPPEGSPSLSAWRPAAPLLFSYCRKSRCRQSSHPQTRLHRRTRFDIFQYNVPDFLLIQGRGEDKLSGYPALKLPSEDSEPELRICLQFRYSNVWPRRPSPLPHPEHQICRNRLQKTVPCPGCHR